MLLCKWFVNIYIVYYVYVKRLFIVMLIFCRILNLKEVEKLFYNYK